MGAYPPLRCGIYPILILPFSSVIIMRATAHDYIIIPCRHACMHKSIMLLRLHVYYNYCIQSTSYIFCMHYIAQSCSSYNNYST